MCTRLNSLYAYLIGFLWFRTAVLITMLIQMSSIAGTDIGEGRNIGQSSCVSDRNLPER